MCLSKYWFGLMGLLLRVAVCGEHRGAESLIAAQVF